MEKYSVMATIVCYVEIENIEANSVEEAEEIASQISVDSERWIVNGQELTIDEAIPNSFYPNSL
jgi:hypothetical protein